MLNPELTRQRNIFLSVQSTDNFPEWKLALTNKATEAIRPVKCPCYLEKFHEKSASKFAAFENLES